ncbi:MAG: hypothetical protein GF320_05060, partial [Armatimonadia bacterium]|nr:hypothetical protein [Armatimonadia bacterium]
MNRVRALIVRCLMLGLALLATGALAQDHKQALFERVFGGLAELDGPVAAEVLDLPAGERLLRDTDGDGSPDEAWFLDTDPRSTIKPTLVRAIDEDGDLGESGRPDLDSDLYLADWHADGVVDAAIDYLDTDGDDDPDEMVIFYWRQRMPGLEGECLQAWWSRDLADRNL